VIVFLLFIVVVLIGLTAAAVMGRIGGYMSEPTSSHAFAGVPTGSLSAEDIGALTFDTALRGYRMDQVDEVVDALVARLREVEADPVPLPADGARLPAEGARLPAEGARLPAAERSAAPHEGVSEDADEGVSEDAGLPAGDSRGDGPDPHGV